MPCAVSEAAVVKPVSPSRIPAILLSVGRWAIGAAATVFVVAIAMVGVRQAVARWPKWSATLRMMAAATLESSRDGRQAIVAETGGLRVQSTPVGARVLVDGRDRGATPLTIDDLAAGSHALVLESADGSVRQTVAITPQHSVEIDAAIYAGWLHVSSPIEVDVAEAGRGIPIDERNQVMLPPGPHVLRFENRALGFSDVQHVDIEPGITTSVLVAPPPSTISVTATLPADVLIDGERAGETPLVNYPTDIGTREVTIRAATGAVRRKTITVTVNPAHLEIDFSKP